MPPAEPARYWAFISYSHSDVRIAQRLASAIESYRLPAKLIAHRPADLLAHRPADLPKRLFPVFRDRDELAASSDLGAVIQDALLRSRSLIVVCSPGAARSRWVDAEISAFRRTHGGESIFAVVVDGQPADVFPRALLHDEAGNPLSEPLWIDLRPGVGEPLREGVLRLIAAILGLEFDTLRRRERIRAVRRRIAGGVVAAVVAASLIVAGANVMHAAHARYVAAAEALAADGKAADVLDAYRRVQTPATRSALLGVLQKASVRATRMIPGAGHRPDSYAFADAGNTLVAFGFKDTRPQIDARREQAILVAAPRAAAPRWHVVPWSGTPSAVCGFDRSARFAVAADDGTVSLVDSRSLRRVHVVALPSSALACIATGGVAAATNDHRIVILNAELQPTREAYRVQHAYAAVDSLAVDGRWIAASVLPAGSAAQRTTLFVIDRETGDEFSFGDRSEAAVNCDGPSTATFPALARSRLTTVTDGGAYQWFLGACRTYRTASVPFAPGKDNPTVGAAYDVDAVWPWVVSEMSLWEMGASGFEPGAPARYEERFTVPTSLFGPTPRMRGAFDLAGLTIAARDDDPDHGERTQLIEVRRGAQELLSAVEREIAPAHPAHLESGAWATATDDGTFFSTEDGTIVDPRTAKPALHVAFENALSRAARDGTIALADERSGRVVLARPSGGARVIAHLAHPHDVAAVALSSDAARVFVETGQGAIETIDAATGATHAVEIGGGLDPATLVLSPHGSYVFGESCTGEETCRFHVQRLSGGRFVDLWSRPVPLETIQGVTSKRDLSPKFTEDEQTLLLIGSSDTSVVDCATGAAVASVNARLSDLSNDRRVGVYAEPFAGLQLYDMANGTRLGAPFWLASVSNASLVQFTPSGRALINLGTREEAPTATNLTETAIRFTRIDLDEQHWYTALCARAGGCRS